MEIFGIEISTTIILIVVGAFVLLFLICLAIANFAGENLLTVFQKYEEKVKDLDYITCGNTEKQISFDVLQTGKMILGQ